MDLTTQAVVAPIVVAPQVELLKTHTKTGDLRERWVLTWNVVQGDKVLASFKTRREAIKERDRLRLVARFAD